MKRPGARQPLKAARVALRAERPPPERRAMGRRAAAWHRARMVRQGRPPVAPGPRPEVKLRPVVKRLLEVRRAPAARARAPGSSHRPLAVRAAALHRAPRRPRARVRAVAE